MRAFILPLLLLPLAVVDENQTSTPNAKSGTPPTARQVEAIATLVRETEKRDVELKIRVQRLQHQLQLAYADFELDHERIAGLQEQIIMSQKDLLLNYNRLQVGYRDIMGPERFRKIKDRIESYLKKAEERRNQQTPAPTESLKTP